MKKLTFKQKLYLKRHALSSQLGKLRLKLNKKISLLKKINKDLAIPYEEKKAFRRQQGKTTVLLLPEKMNFANNYNETVEFLNDFRIQALKQNKKIRLEFRTLIEISASAALVLVSELDRWRKTFSFDPVAIKLDEWDPEILRLLIQKGFFKILNVQNPPKLTTASKSDLNFIEFLTNKVTAEEEVEILHRALEENSKNVPHTSELFKALSEAMTNVTQHAYDKNLMKNRQLILPYIPNTWWLSGSVNTKSNVIEVLFFDQGVGIPKTLPKYSTESGFMTKALGNLGLKDSHASRIEAATQMRKSRLGKPHRGLGLPEILDFIKKSKKGRLRIISDKGEFVYDTVGKKLRKNHKASLGGTLIQWEMKLDKA